jgi:hypothetical protein
MIMFHLVATLAVVATLSMPAQAADDAKGDLAECKMAALRLGRWDRDTWDASTPTGQYLMACMTAKGYRRITLSWNETYNPMDEVVAKKKPLYRSKELEFLVESGCYGDSNFSIAIAEYWQK